MTYLWIKGMVICMRTTIDIDDTLMKEAKKRAAETGQTLREVIEESLREFLKRESENRATPFKMEWIVVKGALRPGVDLSDRRSLLDLMDGPS